MKHSVACLLTFALLVGCGPRPSLSPSSGAPAAGDLLPSPVPEHLRLIGLKVRTPTEQAQLLLYEALQARGNIRQGTDRSKVEFSSGVSYPVKAEWKFDEKCESLTVAITWDPRIKTNQDIQVAVSRVLNNSFWRDLDSFYFLHGAIQWRGARVPLKPVNSKAVFYCTARRTADNEMIIVASATSPLQRQVEQEH